MQKAYEIRVHGDVQGVLFRAHAKEQADRLGLKGFVRNEPDGSVLIEAEGEQAQLDQLVAWCNEGSPSAHVTKVEAKETEYKHHSQFRAE